MTDGGDLASTWVTKPEVHAEDVVGLVKNRCKLIVANDDNFYADEDGGAIAA